MSINSDDVRKGITQANFNEKYSGFLFSELSVLSIACGLYWHSWWVFGIVYFGFIVCLIVQKLATILCILLSIVWGIIGYFIGTLFDSLGASVVLSIIGLLTSGGAHISALQYTKDLE
jgi:hypothetical protein